MRENRHPPIPLTELPSSSACKKKDRGYKVALTARSADGPTCFLRWGYGVRKKKGDEASHVDETTIRRTRCGPSGDRTRDNGARSGASADRGSQHRHDLALRPGRNAAVVSGRS